MRKLKTIHLSRKQKGSSVGRRNKIYVFIEQGWALIAIVHGKVYILVTHLRRITFLRVAGGDYQGLVRN